MEEKNSVKLRILGPWLFLLDTTTISTLRNCLSNKKRKERKKENSHPQVRGEKGNMDDLMGFGDWLTTKMSSGLSENTKRFCSHTMTEPLRCTNPNSKMIWNLLTSSHICCHNIQHCYQFLLVSLFLYLLVVCVRLCVCARAHRIS